MAEVKIMEVIKLENLAEGKIFDKDEVIIHVNKNKTGMDTIRKTPETDEIGLFMYDIRHNGKIVDSINNNGCRYFNPENEGDSENWRRYSEIIKQYIR